MPLPSFARWVLVFGAFGATTACVETFPGGSTPVRLGADSRRSASPAGATTVYVTSRNNGRILAFPITGNGNVAPSRRIKGAKTQLTAPVALAISSTGRIYAANDSANNVLIFAPGAHGDAKPQVLGGSNVPLHETEGITLDASGEIYVSDYSAAQILVFAAGATGNTAPIRTIQGSKTGLTEPLGMAVDSAGNLFVVNGTYPSTMSILEFASGANGNVAPISYIGGSNTLIVQPQSVSLDSTGRIIVPSNSNSVLIFSKGSSGNVAPVAVITGSATHLAGVSSVGVDPSDEIFVTECCPTHGAVYVFASTADGNVPPIRSILGSKTQLKDAFYPSFH
jgi:hypothetical protein